MGYDDNICSRPSGKIILAIETLRLANWEDDLMLIDGVNGAQNGLSQSLCEIKTDNVRTLYAASRVRSQAPSKFQLCLCSLSQLAELRSK